MRVTPIASSSNFAPAAVTTASSCSRFLYDIFVSVKNTMLLSFSTPFHGTRVSGITSRCSSATLPFLLVQVVGEVSFSWWAK